MKGKKEQKKVVEGNETIRGRESRTEEQKYIILEHRTK
jgi:hypothetical protein